MKKVLSILCFLPLFFLFQNCSEMQSAELLSKSSSSEPAKSEATCKISAPEKVYKNQKLTVKWVSQNAKHLKIKGIPPGTTYPKNNTSGSYTFDSIQISRTFTCEVESYEGQISNNVTNTSVIDLAGQMVTADEYLKAQKTLNPKKGHTLPPLTRWSYPISFETKKELADRWGFALELGYIRDNDLSNPNSDINRLIALKKENPSYKTVAFSYYFQIEDQENEAYLRDKQGDFILNASGKKIWSPEAPYRILTSISDQIQNNLSKVSSQIPIDIVLSSGERGLDVLGHIETKLEMDPKVKSAIGDQDPSDYISRKKAFQEQVYADGVKAAAPNATYIYYKTGNSNSESLSRRWDWDFKYMKDVVSFPSTSVYYGFNTGDCITKGEYRDCTDGWKSDPTNRNDALSRALNAYAYDRQQGVYLSYNWVNAGHTRRDQSIVKADPNMYKGYLRSYYNAGMIGGIATYFFSPTSNMMSKFNFNSPPDWLVQIKILAEVHSEYTYLDKIIRNSHLLSGLGVNSQWFGLRTYEYPSIHKDARIIIRKVNGKKHWLLSAWSSDGINHNGSVHIPNLGHIKVTATPSANLYDLKVVNGKLKQTLLITGSNDKSGVNIPNEHPDND